MSSADIAFINTCKEILENGTWVKEEGVRPKWADGTPAYTKKKFGVVNRYDLEKEFPLITIRPLKLSVAVDEILWIWQKKSNNIHDLGSHIWDLWADETGSIGKAYGYQLRIKHQYKEGMFDQVDRVLYDLKYNRCSRRILTNLYNFEDLHEMALYPCAYSMTFNVTDGRLCAILLICMFAQVSGLVPGEFVHVIADAHIYDRHIPIVEELIRRPVYPAPQVELDKTITDFYDFTPESFTVSNYRHGEKIGKIEMAI